MPVRIEPRQGTAIFQWMLTLGIVCRRIRGYVLQLSRGGRGKGLRCAGCFNFKDQTWRRIFWVSMPPGALFVLGSLFVTESPRWLFQRGKALRAHAALLRSRSPEQAAIEIEEMASVTHAAKALLGEKIKDSLLQRKYVNSLPAGLRDSDLQHGDRGQLDHQLQHQHLVAERASPTFMRTGATSCSRL